MFIKYFFRNLSQGVFLSFLFFVALTVLDSSVEAAAPTVVGTIPDQEAIEGELFKMSFDIYEVFSDADNDTLSATVTQADDSALLTWLTSETKPFAPHLIGSYDASTSAGGVTIVGNYAYVSDGTAGLKIIDISTLTSPSLVGAYDTSGYASGVAVVGNYAYVADSASGLQIIDVSTPSRP